MSEQIKPLKRFGQNFLLNIGIAEKIVAALEPKENDNIIEIGAGKGVLTKLLLNAGPKQLIAVEIDPRLIDILQDLTCRDTNYKIKQLDFLDLRLDELRILGTKIKVIGNIPYNLTSSILFKLLDNFKEVSKAVLMVQKEVADRIVANPGNKEYGILSVLTAVHGLVRKEFNVKKENFFPRPKVDSAVISIDFFHELNDIKDYELLKTIVQGTFQTRRKMLHNSLKRVVGVKITDIIKCQDLSRRPEELTASNFIALSNEIFDLKKVF